MDSMTTDFRCENVKPLMYVKEISVHSKGLSTAPRLHERLYTLCVPVLEHWADIPHSVRQIVHENIQVAKAS